MKLSTINIILIAINFILMYFFPEGAQMFLFAIIMSGFGAIIASYGEKQ